MAAARTHSHAHRAMGGMNTAVLNTINAIWRRKIGDDWQKELKSLFILMECA